MLDYTNMVDVIPECSVGVAEVKHLEVSPTESDFTMIRALSHGTDCFVPEGRYVQLYVDGKLMMSDTPAERRSNRVLLRRAWGRVLIAGLGIGMVVLPLARSSEVREITVVEKYSDVVSLILPALQSHLGSEEFQKLRIVEADIFSWKPPRGAKWDTIYFDVWPDLSTSTLKEMAKLHRRFGRFKSADGWMDSWRREDLRRKARKPKKYSSGYYWARW